MIKKMYSESILEQEFTAFLQNETIETVSFDIFETLVFRDVTKPIDIFTKVGRDPFVKKIYNCEHIFCEFRIQAEKKARKRYTEFEEITLEMIYDELDLSQKQKEKIQTIELLEEHKSLYINKQIERWIKLAKDTGKQVLLLSDMYLSKKNIEKIVLSKLKNPDHIDAIYMSSANNATKASGSLFLKVLNIRDIQANSMIHIGDNPASDVRVPKSLGINVLHYNVSSYVQNLYKIEYGFIQNDIEKGHNFRQLASLLNPYTKEKERFFFELGANIFGTLMWEFAHWCKDVAKTHKFSQINTVMREGRIFQKYLHKFDESLDVNLIYASRKSTFLPALDANSFEKNNINFYNYRKFSIENFYALFGISIHNKDILKHKQMQLSNANFVHIGKDSLLNMIGDEFQRNLHNIKKNANKENERFLTYLKSCNYTPKSAFLDFGGTGTILQNIDAALPKKERSKLSLLFYMHESGYNKMLGKNTLSFLTFSQKNKPKLELLRRSPEFIEILFNGANTTTIGYETKVDNSIMPVLDKKQPHFKELQCVIDAFDSGIDAFFAIAKSYNIGSVYTRELLLDMLFRLLKIPTYDEALHLGNLVHDEGYGSDILQTIITESHIQAIKKTGVLQTYNNACKNVTYKIGEITWINGTITKLDPFVIQNMHSITSKSGNTDAINTILNILQNEIAIKNIAIYGGGQFYEELRPHLHYNIVDIFDTRAKFSKFSIDGLEVKTLQDATFEQYDAIVVASAVYAKEITVSIAQAAKEQNKKITIVNVTDGILFL